MTHAYAWVVTVGLLTLAIALSSNSFRLHRVGNARASDWCLLGASLATAAGIAVMQLYLNSAEP